MLRINFTKKIKPIFSPLPSIHNMLSTAGGDLIGKNVAVITNDLKSIDKYKKSAEIENTYINIVSWNDIEDKQKIHKDGFEKKVTNSLFGKIDIIINDVYLEEMPFSSELDKIEFDHKIILTIYQLLQLESDFLINQKKQSHIVNICRGATIGDKSLSRFIATLTKGLGQCMCNHNIIVNGICSNGDCNKTDMVKIAMFLASRYGECLCGEVLELNN